VIVRRRVLYLTTWNTHKGETSKLPAAYEPAPRKQAAVDPHLRPRGHLDRHDAVYEAK